MDNALEFITFTERGDDDDDDDDDERQLGQDEEGKLCDDDFITLEESGCPVEV